MKFRSFRVFSKWQSHNLFMFRTNQPQEFLTIYSWLIISLNQPKLTNITRVLYLNNASQNEHAEFRKYSNFDRNMYSANHMVTGRP